MLLDRDIWDARNVRNSHSEYSHCLDAYLRSSVIECWDCDWLLHRIRTKYVYKSEHRSCIVQYVEFVNAWELTADIYRIAGKTANVFCGCGKNNKNKIRNKKDNPYIKIICFHEKFR